MYAYVTLKFEIREDDLKGNLLREIPAQTVAEEYAHYACDRSEADEIAKVEIKND